MHLLGVPTAVISKWLGHSSPAFTMRTYVHSQPKQLSGRRDVDDSTGRVVTQKRGCDHGVTKWPVT
jgi:integrase